MKITLWLSGLFLLLGGMTWGQVTTGTISGTVKDSSGAVLPGTKIVVLNDNTGISRTVEADTVGHYSASSLGLGNYRITATQDGFQTQVRSGVVLTVGQEAVVDMVLSVGAVNQTVEVTGQASTIETTTSAVSALVSGEQIRDLPLNGRSIDSLALLTPGVLADRTALQTASLGMGTRISINGSRVDATLYLLDGTYVNDQGGGGPGSAGHNMLGVEGILEFRLLSHNFSAEYGRVGGAVMSMVTRSGSNEFHGTIYEFVRNNIFDARNFFNPGELPPFRRNQFGTSVGGHIVKDRVFFFGNYEGLRQVQGTTINIPVPDLNARRGFLPNGTGGLRQVANFKSAVVPFVNLYPFPNGRSYGDGTAQYLTTFKEVTNENYYMARTDFRLSDKDNIFLRYVFNPSDVLVARPTPNWAESITGGSHFAVLSHTHIFSGNSLNDFRVAYNRTNLRTDPITLIQIDPAVTFVPGQDVGQMTFTAQSSGTGQLAELGSSQTRPQYFPQNVFQESEIFSTVRGAHSLKFGLDVQRVQINQNVGIGGLRGRMTFGGLEPFLASTPTQFQVTLPSSNNHFQRGWRRTVVGWFIQDDYRIRSNLTLNLGLRQDIFFTPSEVHGYSGALINMTDPTPTAGPPFISNKNTYSPRVGLAWDPTGSGKTSVRVGAGLYYSPVDGRGYYVGSDGGPLFASNVIVTNPPFPYGLSAGGAAAGKPGIVTLPYHISNPTTAQYSLEVQRQLTGTLSLRVGYVGSTGYHLSRQQQINTKFPTIAPDGTKSFAATGPVVNSVFSTIGLYSTDARSNYDGLQVTIQKELSAGLRLQANYSWSKAISSADASIPSISASTAAATLDKDNLRRDYGLSVYDQRHTFRLNSAYQLPWDRRLTGSIAKAFLGGWSVNGIYSYGSGLPFNLLDGFNNSRNGDTTFPDRPSLNPGFSNNPISGVSAGCAGAGILPGQKLGTPERWFDPCAFSLSPLGTYGNLGRNTVIGPGVNNVDFTLLKATALTERTKLEFRWELFNILNHAQFAVPNLTVFTSARGYNGSAGTITSTARDNRQMQLGLKLIF
jgi:hypothetical protein